MTTDSTTQDSYSDWMDEVDEIHMNDEDYEHKYDDIYMTYDFEEHFDDDASPEQAYELFKGEIS
jgi:hypothetical protein